MCAVCGVRCGLEACKLRVKVEVAEFEFFSSRLSLKLERTIEDKFEDNSCLDRLSWLLVLFFVANDYCTA
jgi:hypothetical protein